MGFLWLRGVVDSAPEYRRIRDKEEAMKLLNVMIWEIKERMEVS